MGEAAKLSYTIKEAAAAVGVSVATIWRDVAAGELTTYKWHSRTLIRADVLEGLVDRRSGRGRQATGA